MAKKKQSGKSKTGKKISFSLSWTGLFFTGFSIFLSLVWAFILGVIVGRGYEPGNFFSDLRGCSRQQNEQAVQTKSRQEEQVLQPQELGFYESLKKSGQLNSGVETNLDQSKKKSQQKKGLGQRNNSQIEKNKKKSESVNKVYAYLYQVAAFKEMKKAKSLLEQIKSQQINGYVKEVKVKNTEWFRVYVNFQGTIQQVQGLKSELSKLGIDHPFVRSKRRIM